MNKRNNCKHEASIHCPNCCYSLLPWKCHENKEVLSLDLESKVKYTDEIATGIFRIRCLVLENGARVIEEKEFNKSFVLDLPLITKHCYLCDKHLPKISKSLNKFKEDSPHLFTSLIRENFICNGCRKNLNYERKT